MRLPGGGFSATVMQLLSLAWLKDPRLPMTQEGEHQTISRPRAAQEVRRIRQACAVNGARLRRRLRPPLSAC